MADEYDVVEVREVGLVGGGTHRHRQGEAPAREDVARGDEDEPVDA
jgi:hypothetical protein